MLTHRGQQVYQAFKLLFLCQYLQALCLYQENLIEEEAEAKGKTASRAKNSDLGFYIEGGTTENWRCIEENREVFSGLAPEFPVRKNDAVSKQYIYGNGIDDIVRMDVFSGSTGTPYYFHQDHIGNVTAITDGSGNVVERVSYDLYGKPTFTDGSGSALTQSSIGNTLLFQSREYDGETSLYHFRARAYDPFMGRFLQTDPMGYADSMNLYQAFNMNPFNFTDPMGEAIINLFLGFPRDAHNQMVKREKPFTLNPYTNEKIFGLEKLTPYPYKKFEELENIARSKGHILFLKDFSDGDPQKAADAYSYFASITSKDSKVNKFFAPVHDIYTIFVGHSNQENDLSYTGLKFGNLITLVQNKILN